ncbi:MAG: hypothetical protein KDA52_17340, partial [Planctomycetaceae bacterium]|nr:hypothetical protein [Planctomycetaceae bacterium]
MTSMRFAASHLIIALFVLLPSITCGADGPTRQEAVDAMHRAVRFFRNKCSTSGGYVYRVSDDLTKR